MSYQQDRFREIADAIRVKKGTTELIKPVNFATEIINLPTDYIEYQDLFENILYNSPVPSPEEYINDIKPSIINLALKVWGYRL